MRCYGGETVTTTTSHVGAAWHSGIELPPTTFCNFCMGRCIQRSSRGLIASVKRPCIFLGYSAPGSYQKCLVWTVVGVTVGLKTPGNFPGISREFPGNFAGIIFPGIVHVLWKWLISVNLNYIFWMSCGYQSTTMAHLERIKCNVTGCRMIMVSHWNRNCRNHSPSLNFDNKCHWLMETNT